MRPDEFPGIITGISMSFNESQIVINVCQFIESQILNVKVNCTSAKDTISLIIIKIKFLIYNFFLLQYNHHSAAKSAPPKRFVTARVRISSATIVAAIGGFTVMAIYFTSFRKNKQKQPEINDNRLVAV